MSASGLYYIVDKCHMISQDVLYYVSVRAPAPARKCAGEPAAPQNVYRIMQSIPRYQEYNKLVIMHRIWGEPEDDSKGVYLFIRQFKFFIRK